MRDYGRRIITGKSENGAQMTMPAQVADANEVLGSARAMVEAGNRVAFDRDNEVGPRSYALRKATERSGISQFRFKVPRGNATKPVRRLSEESRDEGGRGVTGSGPSH